MKVKTYFFEGAERTMREIMAMVPCLSKTTVHSRLKQGYNTILGMMSYAGSTKGQDAARERYKREGERYGIF